MSAPKDSLHPRDAEIDLLLSRPVVEVAPDFTDRLMQRLRENEPNIDPDDAIDAWLCRQSLRAGEEFKSSLQERLQAERNQRQSSRRRLYWATLVPAGIAAAFALVWFSPTSAPVAPSGEQSPAVAYTTEQENIATEEQPMAAATSFESMASNMAAPGSLIEETESDILQETSSIPEDVERELYFLAENLGGAQGLVDLDNLDTIALFVP